MQEATLTHKQTIAPETVSFWFEPSNPVEYQAGQFITLHLPHKSVDDRGDKRWFTLSSSPTEGQLCITTKLGAHLSSFKNHLASLKGGDKVHIGQAMGDFVLPLSRDKPLIFLVAGIGIAPLRSILTYLADTHDVRDITIHYGSKRQQDICYQDLLSNVQDRTTIWLSNPPPRAWSGATGRIDLATVIQNLNQKQRSHGLFYVAGPESFTEETVQALHTQHGIDESRIIGDYYHGYDASA